MAAQQSGREMDDTKSSAEDAGATVVMCDADATDMQLSGGGCGKGAIDKCGDSGGDGGSSEDGGDISSGNGGGGNNGSEGVDSNGSDRKSSNTEGGMSSPSAKAESPQPSHPDPVVRCVSMLKKARNDNEKFAALLMVTKMVKAENLMDGDKSKLLDAIGVDFLLRMLRDDVAPEGCPPFMFKSIALTIFACFVTNCHEREEFYDIIPELCRVIGDPELYDDNLMLIKDAYQCLEGITLHKTGRRAIISHEGLTTLVEAYVLSNFCQDLSLKILMIIMSEEGSNTWDDFPEEFTKLVTNLCDGFCTKQEEQKFELCLTLVEVLHSMPESIPGEDGYEWQKQLHKGLSDILLSKLGKEQRNCGLSLGAAALDTMGAAWVVSGGPRGHQLLLIMVHLACIEVRMSLENQPFEKTVAMAHQTTSCYSILENAIKFLVNGALEMEEKQKQQLYAALKGAFNAVLVFLKDVCEEKLHTSNDKTQMFICATIRVLAAWLAEETSANKVEVYGILPFVINMAQYNFRWNQKHTKPKRGKSKSRTQSTKGELPDLLRFFLPGLCHLTAEDEPRFILLDLGIEQLLFDYFVVKYDLFTSLLNNKKKQNVSLTEELDFDSIVTLCSIFMNIVVQSPSDIQSKPLYFKLLKYIFSRVPELPLESVYLPLCGNICTLGLMILRHQFMYIKNSDIGIFKFIQCTVRFLWDAHNVEESQDYASLVVSQKYHSQWNELMELWYLGMHNLMILLAYVPWLCDFLLESEWPQNLVSTLLQSRPDGGIEPGLKAALEDLLTMIVRTSVPAKWALLEAGAETAANTHSMMSLLQELKI